MDDRETYNQTKKLNPGHGILIFFLSFVLLFFVGTALQVLFGMAGLAMTEIMLLGVAILPVIPWEQDWKRVFPFQKPKARHISGALLIWLGSFLGANLIALVTAYFFPQDMIQINQYMNRLFGSVPVAVSFLIAALLPAVCEEALFRGMIQYTFVRVRREWIAVSAVGLMFGVFHMDIYRFLPTAVLGMGFAYVMSKRANLFLPMLLHFINNTLAFAASGVAQPEQSHDPSSYLLSIGVYLLPGAAIPFCLFFGSVLLREKTAGESKRKTAVPLLCSALLFVILFALGITLISLQAVKGTPLSAAGFAGRLLDAVSAGIAVNSPFSR